MTGGALHVHVDEVEGCVGYVCMVVQMASWARMKEGREDLRGFTISTCYPALEECLAGG